MHTMGEMMIVTGFTVRMYVAVDVKNLSSYSQGVFNDKKSHS